MQVGQLVLGADGELLDQELEVVIAESATISFSGSAARTGAAGSIQPSGPAWLQLRGL